jgi:hypothetical protein
MLSFSVSHVLRNEVELTVQELSEDLNGVLDLSDLNRES